jgi:flagellar assembly protein FliH
VPMRRPQPVKAPMQVAGEAKPAIEVLSMAKQAPPALTLAAVSAWLAEQDRDTLTSAMPGLASELEEIREDAHAAGFNAGQIDGRTASQEQVVQLQALLESLVEALRTQYEQEQARLAALCVDIVATAFTKVAGPLLASREAAYAAVAEALARAKAGHELTVRISPVDLPVLEPQREQLAALVCAPLTLVADPQVVLGGCVIESQPGTLDARLEVQLQGLYDTLRAAKQQVRTP